MNSTTPVSLRWTVGDVSFRGLEALRLSVWGAHWLFGSEASYTICVNTIAVAQAQELTGDLPETVHWRQVTLADIPAFLLPHIDGSMAEGAAWKLSPLRIAPDAHELALNNDCILWDVPAAMRLWLNAADRALLTEDAAPAFGSFADPCADKPYATGLRGLPPHFQYEHALQQVLAERPVTLRSELDEQGLQAAALQRALPVDVVPAEDVTTCSPFPPHRAELGRSGAYFVGLNARHLSGDFHGRPALLQRIEHWSRHRESLYERVGLAAPHIATAC
jgi:hypothetical protein